MVLYWTRIRFRGCGTAVLLPSKRSGREVQPLAALYPTVRLSPWRQVRKKYSLQGVNPQSHLIFTPPRRATPPGSPSFLVTGGYGPHPRRLIRTPIQGGYSRYHSILSPPRRASHLVPLPLDLRASLPPEFRALPFVCFLSGTWHRASWKTLLIYDKNHGLTPLENLVFFSFFQNFLFLV